MSSLRVTGTDLYYLEQGEGDTVLWLQGLGATHSAWSAQFPTFGPRYHCLAPDNRGSGRTPPGQVLDLPLIAQDAADLLSARSTNRPAHVVGLSMGASVAIELALRAPHLVRSLVLVSASAYIEPRLRELLLAWRDIYPRVPPGVFQRQANTWLFSWRFFEKAGAAETVIRYAERESSPSEWFVAQVDAAMSHDARSRVHEIDVPVLVLTGSDDQMVPPRLGRALAEAIPGARFLEIGQAGHSVNLEQQRAFNEAVESFLATH